MGVTGVLISATLLTSFGSEGTDATEAVVVPLTLAGVTELPATVVVPDTEAEFATVVVEVVPATVVVEDTLATVVVDETGTVVLIPEVVIGFTVVVGLDNTFDGVVGLITVTGSKVIVPEQNWPLTQFGSISIPCLKGLKASRPSPSARAWLSSSISASARAI